MPANGLPSSTMTIQEAATHWRDPKSPYLKRWGETFGIRLMDVHVGHFITYQSERSKEVATQTIDLEVDALLTLLRELHLGAEIESDTSGMGRPPQNSPLTKLRLCRNGYELIS